jgi:hypothetical protein
MTAKKQKICLSTLPGEPTDGTGRICIHLFVQDIRGPFVEPSVIHPAVDADGNPDPRKLIAKPTRGRLACSRTRQVRPVTKGGVTTLTMRTDEPRAVTCPACIASDSYRLMMESNKE